MLVTIHSLLRWLVLLAAVGALVGYGRALRSGPDAVAERLGSLYAAMIGIQVLLGILLWLIEGRWDMDNVFFSAIHPVIMLLATGVASAGVARARRTASAVTGLVAVGVSLALVLLGIPW
jgi:hypothetical protein